MTDLFATRSVPARTFIKVRAAGIRFVPALFLAAGLIACSEEAQPPAPAPQPQAAAPSPPAATHAAPTPTSSPAATLPAESPRRGESLGLRRGELEEKIRNLEGSAWAGFTWTWLEDSGKAVSDAHPWLALGAITTGDTVDAFTIQASLKEEDSANLAGDKSSALLGLVSAFMGAPKQEVGDWLAASLGKVGGGQRSFALEGRGYLTLLNVETREGVVDLTLFVSGAPK